MRPPPFVPGRTPIPLMVPQFGPEEIEAALRVLLSGRVTMGRNVEAFERRFAQYLGASHAIMVNSGSSANLLALSLLTLEKDRPLRPGDEIITPAVTWATTVYPIAQLGCVPVLVDVELPSYNMNAESLSEAMGKRTRALLPVHLLGNPVEMKPLIELADERDLFLVEDACESHGAEVAGRKVGTFGDLGTFSFFLSHHITTIEGGMVVTNRDDLAERARAARVFGWIRPLRRQKFYRERYPHIDPRYLFAFPGFNFRPMETQGAFGLRQLSRLEAFIRIRRENARYWNRKFQPYQEFLVLPEERAGTRHVWFGYPLTVRPDAPFTRKDVVSHLEKNGIETRPLMAGNIAEQPAMERIPHRISGRLANARLVMRNSFFFGNHQGIGKREREFIGEVLCEFLERRIG